MATIRTTAEQPRPISVSTANGPAATISPPTRSRVPAGRTLAAPQPVAAVRTTTGSTQLPGVDAVARRIEQPAQITPPMIRNPAAGGIMPAPQPAPQPATLPQPTPAPQPVPEPPVPAAPTQAAPAPEPAPPNAWQDILAQLNASLGGGAAQTVTGEEVPFTVMPGRSEQLTGVLDLLQNQLSDQLTNPDPYSGELWEGIVGDAEQALGRAFDRAENQVSSQLASRGLDYSTIAGSEFADLAADRNRAFEQFMRPLMRERAQATAANRAQAFGNASGLASFLAGLEGMERGELRGERGYIDNLRGQARDQAIQEMLLEEQLAGGRESEFLGLLSQALGLGYTNPNLTSPGALLGQAANTAAGQQAGTNALLGQLGGILMQQWMNRGSTS